MGILVLMGAIMLIAFSILLLVPAGAQNAFAGLSEAPTCTAGFLYNTSTDMCEKLPLLHLLVQMVLLSIHPLICVRE